MRPLAALLGVCLLGSCTQVVRYTDELTDPAMGRSWIVRAPAAFGGVAGFVAGFPFDLLALPATWVVYQTQPVESRDALSTFLFPSVVLQRAGVLIAVPFDAVEFVVWRAWQPEVALSPEELERRERLLDEDELKGMPVEPIHGDPPPRPERSGTPLAR